MFLFLHLNFQRLRPKLNLILAEDDNFYTLSFTENY